MSVSAAVIKTTGAGCCSTKITPSAVGFQPPGSVARTMHKRLGMGFKKRSRKAFLSYRVFDANAGGCRDAIGNRTKNVVHLSAKKLRVTTNPPQKVVLDGEIIGTTPIEVECIPAGLRVFAPPAQASAQDSTATAALEASAIEEAEVIEAKP